MEYEFFGRICAARTLEEYAAHIIPFCRQTFAVQNVIALRYHRVGAPESLFQWVCEPHLEALFDRDYHRFGYMLDPFYKLAFETQDWAVSALREIAPDRFETSEYFSSYLGATGLVDDVGFVARVNEETAIHLSLGRHSGTKRFRASEVARFRSLSAVLVPGMLSVLGKPAKRDPQSHASVEHRFLKASREAGTEISTREAEVAALIVQGHSSRAIGLNLGISGHTVKVHRRNLYKKLGISSQSELFGLLTRQGGRS